MNIKLERIIEDIETLATFNATPGKGVTRLSFTKEDKEAREYIRNRMEEIGLKTWEDGYSNLFGRKEGKDLNAPVIMIGSHFDSVINGGPFDGVAGLVTALEVARVLVENDVDHHYPIEVVAMNDEEGVRFGTGLSNSRAMIGAMDEAELDSAVDKDGISLRQAMLDFGITPNLEDAKREKGSIKAFLELHIEQGPILEDEGKEIGLVETIVGIDKYDCVFKGNSGHAGTTPMVDRRDALIGAAEFALAINRIVRKVGEGTVGTVGEFNISPNAPNVIPGQVQMSIDIRSGKDENIKKVEKEMMEELKRIGDSLNLETEIKKSLYVPPVNMSEEIIGIMEEKVKELGYSYKRMDSGAGHDSMIMAEIAPTSLIFVPSKDGLSHHPDEWTDYEAIKKGVELMLKTVVELGREGL
ncbi:MAG TPA: M20 family metallo-hydrolase [Tepidimicrobium sp.]|nr:M20 family metallo-hydrolase [Tepidimicrobium sp.]